MSATRYLGAFLASSLLANACARAPAPPSDPFAGRWVDLSYDFSGEMMKIKGGSGGPLRIVALIGEAPR
jgi:hypothetical protein